MSQILFFQSGEKAFIRDFATLLYNVTYGPMEYVYDEDESVEQMFIIVKGRVQIEDWAGDQLHASWEIEAPEVFAEDLLLYRTAAYVAARTMTFCEFAAMRRGDFMHLLDQYPDMRAPFRRHTVKMFWQRIFRALILMTDEDLMDIITTMPGPAAVRKESDRIAEEEAALTAGSGVSADVGVLLLREIRRLSGRLDGIEGDVKNVMTKQEHSSEIVYDLREQLAHISRRV